MSFNKIILVAVVAWLTACGGANLDTMDPTTSIGEPSEQPAGDPAPGSDPGPKASELAREYWVILSRGDYELAVSMASFPYDMDAHQGCVDNTQELLAAFLDDPLPSDKEMIVGEAHPVSTDMDVSALHEHWHKRIPRWTGTEAPCLGDDTTAEYRYFLVDFTIDGNLLGALTRVRCRLDECGVAGTDN